MFEFDDTEEASDHENKVQRRVADNKLSSVRCFYKAIRVYIITIMLIIMIIHPRGLGLIELTF